MSMRDAPTDSLACLDAAVFAYLVTPAHLVGHSLGALLALEQAARAPSAIASVTLLALPYFDDEAEARSRLERATVWGRLVLRAPALASLTRSCLCQQRWFWGRVLPILMPRLLLPAFTTIPRSAAMAELRRAVV